MISSSLERRLSVHNEIGLLALRIEHDFTSNIDQLGPLSLKEFIQEGALRYWLTNFLDIIYARWSTTFDDQELIHNLKLASPHRTLFVALPRMSSLNEASQDLEWNRWILTDIHDYLCRVNPLRIEPIDQNPTRNRHIKGSPSVRSSLGPNRRKIYIARSYLPRQAEWLLALTMRTLPVRWKELEIRTKSFDIDARQKLNFHPEAAPPGSFENFARSILSRHLPMSLVENFSEIQIALSKQAKKTPRAFFTANLHVASDSFLIWSVMQRKQGMKLILSQHGGLNGQGLVPTRGEEFEQDFADLYLHWGWSKSLKSVEVPAQINVWSRNRRKSNQLSKLVIITDCTYRLSRRPWVGANDNVRYRKMLLDMYGSLEDSVRQQTIVRLHHDHDKYDESHHSMWRKEFPEINLDDGHNSIWVLRRQARLLVCTSLGTSEIEQFARNMPTVLRLDPQVHALRSSCVALFKDLESVGVVHWSTDSLRQFLRENWLDIDGWWRRDKTQSHLAEYLKRFGQCSPTPIRTIRRIVTESI